MTKRKIGLWLGIVSFFLVLFFGNLEPGKPEITRTAAVAVLMAVWWISEALPLAVTALVPLVAFPMLGVIDGSEISESYINHIIFLFIGGFVMALAMERWGLHKRIALHILKWVGVSPGRILLGFMLATSVLSMWISNTATTMMMIPIVSSIIFELEKNIGKQKISKYSLGLLLGIAYSASIGGNATLVGTPTNLICVRMLSVLYPSAPEISFGQWFMFAMPITLVMFIAAFLLLYLLFRPKEKWNNLSADTFKIQLKQLGETSYEEKVVFVLFLVLAFLWITRSGISSDGFSIPGWASLFQNPKYINDGTTAILISLLLFLWPSKNEIGERIMNWETAHGLPWNIVLLFGGGFALAKGFETSGLALWFGEQLAWGDQIPSIVFVLAIVAMMSFLTELTSNTATTEMILPILAGLSTTIEINPLLLMIPATLAASLAFMLPVATPPNAIVFGTNRIEIKDMVKTGILLNIAGILVATLVMYFWGTLVFDIDVSVFPDWAIVTH